MIAYQLLLPEPASDYIETLLAQETCPVHVNTTLDGGPCQMCAVTAPNPRHEYGVMDCDDCGRLVTILTNPRDLVLVLCADCNGGTAIR